MILVNIFRFLNIEESINVIFSQIALIHLPYKVQFSPSIQPIRLPTTCYSPENVDAIVMGNGVTQYNRGISSQLFFAFLKTLPLNVCRQYMPFIQSRRTIICAHNIQNGQSICKGDSGAPLLRHFDGTLLGISCFSTSKKCQPGALQGFTNIYPFLRWIRWVTGINLPNC